MKKEIPKKGYRTLALAWTLADAAIAVAIVRRMPEFNLVLVVLLLLSTLIAANCWKTYRSIPDEAGPAASAHTDNWDDEDGDGYVAPPPPIGSQLFADDTPPLTHGTNKNSEENDHE